MKKKHSKGQISKNEIPTEIKTTETVTIKEMGIISLTSPIITPPEETLQPEETTPLIIEPIQTPIVSETSIITQPEEIPTDIITPIIKVSKSNPLTKENQINKNVLAYLLKNNINAKIEPITPIKPTDLTHHHITGAHNNFTFHLEITKTIRPTGNPIVLTHIKHNNQTLTFSPLTNPELIHLLTSFETISETETETEVPIINTEKE